MVQYRNCIVFLLAKAYQRAHSCLKRHAGALGLTPAQVLVLEALREEEGLSAKQLGEKILLDPATLSGVLDRLSDRGWIVRTPNPDDRRFSRLFLSHKAREMDSELLTARDKANEEILEELSTEEKVLLKRLLRDISRD